MASLFNRSSWLIVLLAVACCDAGEIGKASKVILTRVPNGGIQPQVALDSKGVVHMVYYVGDPGKGDLYYVLSQDGGSTFSRAVRVNSKPGSAVAAGNIRGAHIALGRNGRVHVAWNGSHASGPVGPPGREPMLYTRLNDAPTAFEPERNLIQVAHGLDGGGAVAADAAGNVYVVWHAPAPGTEGEANRKVWIARSNDDGKTFERERPVWERATGACSCCGLNAFTDDRGTLYVLYRSATEVVNRDMYLLTSRDRCQTFEGSDISRWNVGYCVMSSESFAQSRAGVLAAWETEKQVYFSKVDPRTGKASPPAAAPSSTDNRKHPVVTGNNRGELLLAWTEGMGWKKGGTLAWQVYDESGKPEPKRGQSPGVPVWSLVAAVARPDGGVTIIY